jgi:plasmid replication initiation protein
VSKKLTGIIENFTQVELLDVAQLKSVHSVRLLELLKQVETKQGRGLLKISVEEFKIIMGLDGKYKSFGPLNTRVIEPAVAELNKTTNWTITLERIKKGRAVHQLYFTFAQSGLRKKIEEAKLIHDNPANPQTKSAKRTAVTEAIMDIHDTDW